MNVQYRVLGADRGLRAALVCLVLQGTPGCRPVPAPPVSVDRHEAIVELQSDGSIVVTERFDGRMFERSATFERTIASDRADAVRFVGTAVDGQALTPGGGGAVAVKATEGSRLAVRWVNSGGVDLSVHRIALTYRAEGAVGVLDTGGLLLWPVIDARDRLSVAASRIELRLPDGVAMLRGTGMAETGWSIEVVPRGMVATRASVLREPATLRAEFPVDTTHIVVPTWQVNRDLQGEFAPAFVSGSIFMLVIGVGVIWIVGFQHPRLRADGRPAVTSPADLPEAARRAVRRGAVPRSPDVARDLITRGLVDTERADVARGLRTSAIVGAIVALLCAVVAHLALWRFGWWAQIIPATMLVVALAFVVFARMFRVLTLEGERLRATLRNRSRHP